MTANIFISFAAQDRKVASTLCAALESRGFQCWISARDILPGENFQVAIVRAIRRAKMMLLVFTANSNNSEEMTKELALASQQKLIVVPLRVEDVKPNEAFSYEFATRQWIDFFADWESAINQLCERIETAIPPDPTVVARAAAKAGARTPKVIAPPVEPAPAPEAIAEPPALEAAPEPSAEPEPEPFVEPEPVMAEAPLEEIEDVAEAPIAAAPELEMAAEAAEPAPAPFTAFQVLDTVDTAEEAKAFVAAAAPPAVAKPRSRMGIYAVAAVVLLLLVGLGFAVPALMGKKTEAKLAASAEPHAPSAPAAVAVTTPPPDVVAPPAPETSPVATAAATTAATVDGAAPATGVAPLDPNAPPAVAKPVRPRKPRAAAAAPHHAVRSDVPY